MSIQLVKDLIQEPTSDTPRSYSASHPSSPSDRIVRTHFLSHVQSNGDQRHAAPIEHVNNSNTHGPRADSLYDRRSSVASDQTDHRHTPSFGSPRTHSSSSSSAGLQTYQTAQGPTYPSQEPPKVLHPPATAPTNPPPYSLGQRLSAHVQFGSPLTAPVPQPPPPRWPSEGQLVGHPPVYPYPDDRQAGIGRPLGHWSLTERSVEYGSVPPGRLEPPYAYPGHSSHYQFAPMGASSPAEFHRKRRGNLPKEATQKLKDWFNAHRDSPYPSEDEKTTLCKETGLTMNQVCSLDHGTRSIAFHLQCGDICYLHLINSCEWALPPFLSSFDSVPVSSTEFRG
jgi:hypothetical protein